MWQFYSSVCSLSYASQNLVVKALTRREVDSRTVLWFMFAGAVPVLFVVFWTLSEPNYEPLFPYYLALGVGINLVAFYGYVRAIELADVSLVAPLISLTPLFMLLTSWVMVSEVPDLQGFLGIGLVVVGCYFLAGGRRSLTLEPLLKLVEAPGPRWALAVSVLWSVTANIDKLCVQTSSALAYPFWFHLVFTIAFTPLYLRLRRRGNGLKSFMNRIRSGVLVGSFLVLGGVLQALLVSTQMIALTMTNVSYVIAIKRAGMLVSVLGGGVLFGEEDFRRRFLAATLVFLGLLAIMFR